MTTVSPVRVGILVFHGAAGFDVVGAHEVLATWAARSSLRPSVLLFSPDGTPVRSATGLALVPETDADEAEPLHVLVHPGGDGARRLARHPEHLTWLRHIRRRTALLASIGTGSQPLAAAGLLAGRAVASDPEAAGTLAGLEPSALLDTRARVLDDGDLLTSATGADAAELALHVVERCEGQRASRAVARTLHLRRGG